MTALTSPQFTDETAAIAQLEASRWPDQVNCPRCGSLNVHRMAGKTQAGYFLCNDCRDKFTCRTGTVMERSHIPVHKWLLAIHLMSSSKKGMSAHQLHRMLGVTYKSAWFLAHRIREAMRDGKPAPMGGEGSAVQADETYYGNSSKRAKHYRKGHSQKSGVVALVEPRTGQVRAVVMQKATAETVREFLVTNVDRDSELHTDERRLYISVGKEYAAHKTVNHGWNSRGYYVGPDGQTTNSMSYFRAMPSRSTRASWANSRYCPKSRSTMICGNALPIFVPGSPQLSKIETAFCTIRSPIANMATLSSSIGQPLAIPAHFRSLLNLSKAELTMRKRSIGS